MKDENSNIEMSQELKNKLSEGMLDILEAKKLKNATPSEEILSEKENFALYGIKKNFEDVYQEVISNENIKTLEIDELADVIIKKISDKPENYITKLKEMKDIKNVDDLIKKSIKDLISQSEKSDIKNEDLFNKTKYKA